MFVVLASLFFLAMLILAMLILAMLIFAMLIFAMLVLAMLILAMLILARSLLSSLVRVNMRVRTALITPDGEVAGTCILITNQKPAFCQILRAP
jgi:hypothetical protein